MSDLRPSGISVNLGGQERKLLFTLNAIDVLQDEHGKPIDEIVRSLTNDSNDHKVFISVVTALLNDEADREKTLNEKELPIVTPQLTGWLIDQSNYAEVFIAVLKAYGYSFPEPDEDSDPNPESRRG